MKYINRDTGAPVEAIQFTGPGSVQRIEKEFACRIEYYPDKALLIADDTRLIRGQYAVLTMCSIVAMEQAVFNERHKKDEIQEELFDEAF
jgi:hypothetical protein